MKTENYPQEAPKFQIQAYKKPKNIRLMRKTHVSFSGSPKKHPYDPEQVILVADPFSTNNLFYEFTKEDISYVEELPNLVNQDGEIVEDTRQNP
jgi:inorganic pyrophosphatase